MISGFIKTAASTCLRNMITTLYLGCQRREDCVEFIGVLDHGDRTYANGTSFLQ
jgi:hypothetical protein